MDEEKLKEALRAVVHDEIATAMKKDKDDNKKKSGFIGKNLMEHPGKTILGVGVLSTVAGFGLVKAGGLVGGALYNRISGDSTDQLKAAWSSGSVKVSGMRRR